MLKHASLPAAICLSAFLFTSIPCAHAQAIPPENALRLGDLHITPRVNIRLRSELRDNLTLDQTSESDRWHLLMRTGLGLEISFHAIEFLVDLTDGRELVHEVTSADAPLDFTQLYIALRQPLGLPLSFKVGRQAMNLGSNRLISTSGWSNKQRSWDAVRIDADFQRIQLAAFVGNEVKIDRNDLDHGDLGETLWGLFSAMEISPSTKIELYVFGLYRIAELDPDAPIRGEDGAMGDEHRITPGFRAFGDFDSPKVDWEFEFAFQLGKHASDAIHAFALHGSLGWTLPLLHAPRFGIEVNYASGDPDPEDGLAQTFVPLYGTTHDPYGIADLFRWQNMIEFSPNLRLQLHPMLRMQIEHHTYWLAETADAWVNSSGKRLSAGHAAASRYAGQEMSMIVAWTPDDLFRLEGGFSYFIPGDFVRATGTAKGTAFGYLSGAFKF